MSRYETHYLTWQYFSLSGIRLPTRTWAFLSFRASRSPLVSSILLVCSEEPGSHLGTGCSKHFIRTSYSNVVLNLVLNIILNIESFTESPLSPGGYLPRLSNSAL